jgi:hypothetical protein
MLKSYAAIYKQGHLDWLDDAPEQDNVRVIVTLVDSIHQNRPTQAREILQQAWGCIEKPLSIEQIDADIAQMRSEWE